MFVTKPKRQKFDSIADGHEAAMIAMGVAVGKREAREEGPQCPPDMSGIFEVYRELKFTRRVTEEEVRLYPRDALSWQDLAAYSGVMKNDLSIHDAGVIMGLDAIFEGRDDV